MSAQCQSGCDPCKEICSVCQKSYDDYVTRERTKAVEQAIRVLTYYGYKIEPPASGTAAD